MRAKKKQTVENEFRDKYYQRPFLGLPATKWTSSDLYIKFVNPDKA